MQATDDPPGSWDIPMALREQIAAAAAAAGVSPQAWLAQTVTAARAPASRLSDAALRRVFEQLPVIITRVGADGVFRQQLGGGLARTEHGSNPLAGLDFRDLYSEFASVFERILAGETVSFISRPGTSEPSPAAFSNCAVLDEESGDELLCLSIDITPQVRAEEALRQSEQRLRTAQQVAEIGSWTLDLRLNKLTWSEELFRIHGMTPGDLPEEPRDLFEIFHPDDRQRFSEAIDQAVAHGTSLAQTVRGIRPDGTQRSLVIRGLVECDEQGEPVRMVGTTQDITAHTEMEHRLAESRTREALGTLAASISHDFNNLLTVIAGYAELLESTDPSRASSAIARAAEKGQQLTRQLLSFARQKDVHPVESNLGAVITASADLVRRLVGEDVIVHFALDKAVWPVLIDTGQIDQIILNLAANARDAMPEGGELTVTVRNLVRPTGDVVVLAVSDTGRGIPLEQQERVFEPFYSTRTDQGGTGLGLATVQGIARQRGGDVQLDSTPGRGTTVSVLFPRIEMRSERPSADDNPPTLVVVIDDDEQNRRLAATILTRAGFTVHTAGTPTQAQVLLEDLDGRIDVLVTDVLLPEMFGCDLRKQLAELWGDIPTVFVSGASPGDKRASSCDDPASRWLAKPYAPEELVARIRDAADRRQPAAGLG